MSNTRFMILRLHMMLLAALIPDLSRRVLLGMFTAHRPGKTYSALSEQAHCCITLRGWCLTEPPQDAHVPILTWGAYGGEGVSP